MDKISEFQSPIKAKLDQLLLDPNHPRFAELGEKIDQVPEQRFAEAKVQKAAFDKMKMSRFKVTELRDTIKELGLAEELVPAVCASLENRVAEYSQEGINAPFEISVEEGGVTTKRYLESKPICFVKCGAGRQQLLKSSAK